MAGLTATRRCLLNATWQTRVDYTQCLENLKTSLLYDVIEASDVNNDVIDPVDHGSQRKVSECGRRLHLHYSNTYAT